MKGYTLDEVRECKQAGELRDNQKIHNYHVSRPGKSNEVRHNFYALKKQFKKITIFITIYM